MQVQKSDIIAAFKAAITEIEPRLLKIGFYMKDFTEESVNDSNFYNCIFLSDQSMRVLEVATSTRVLLGHFSIFKLRGYEKAGTPAKIDDVDTYISISDYLYKYNTADLNKLKELDADEMKPPGVTPAEYFRRFFEVVMPHLEGDLLDIVQGKRWENVPMDWSIADR